MRLGASLCTTTTCGLLLCDVRGLRSHPRASRRAVYARSCKRTSQNNPSEAVWKVDLGGCFATLARMRKRYPTDLSDAEWRYIEPHLPASKGHGRPRTHSLREILNAVFYLLKSGCQWRLLPHDFPRWPTVYWYFRKWRLDGAWERINRAIRERLRVRL